MTPEQMAKEAVDAILAGTRMTMVMVRGIKPPRGFPRGEFLCEPVDGRVVRSFDPVKVLAWLTADRRRGRGA